MSPTSAPDKKQDRTTLPTVALLVACGISAYGFRAESDALRWMVPLGLVAASILWVFRPRRAAASPGDAPH